MGRVVLPFLLKVSLQSGRHKSRHTDAGTIIRKAREGGITVPFVGGDGWDSEELPKIAGDAINGNFFTNHYAPDVPWPNSQKFVAKYKERYKRDPSSLAAMGYERAEPVDVPMVGGLVLPCVRMGKAYHPV